MYTNFLYFVFTYLNKIIIVTTCVLITISKVTNITQLLVSVYYYYGRSLYSIIYGENICNTKASVYIKYKCVFVSAIIQKSIHQISNINRTNIHGYFIENSTTVDRTIIIARYLVFVFITCKYYIVLGVNTQNITIILHITR